MLMSRLQYVPLYTCVCFSGTKLQKSRRTPNMSVHLLMRVKKSVSFLSTFNKNSFTKPKKSPFFRLPAVFSMWTWEDEEPENTGSTSARELFPRHVSSVYNYKLSFRCDLRGNVPGRAPSVFYSERLLLERWQTFTAFVRPQLRHSDRTALMKARWQRKVPARAAECETRALSKDNLFLVTKEKGQN